MIGESDKYHGFALRELIINSSQSLSIFRLDREGRANQFVLDAELVIVIKHSSKRLSPWIFVFNDNAYDELLETESGWREVWLIFVCGCDGLVVVRLNEIKCLTEGAGADSRFIRVARARGGMYRVYGNAGKLDGARPQGVSPILRMLNKSQRST